MKFEWDITKERVNIRKRGITFEQASYVFSDPFALSQYDDEHSGPEEDRWVLLGNAMNEIILSVVHTFQDEEGVEHVRIISARKATKAEQQFYRQRCPR
uniref:Uncharacterized protein n=1 Tax=Candidatus Kentrum sp. LPFa TaxID=2126335 RepID=A0A450WG98_9GAMM|nr:MAG: hypothetical protein BECKLPF1236A_GA0070988_1013911 [Candidatus Kentron sp. LPFa]VFK31849.1 MAG: hypothetical protein BECKLPF1236C_GA0070990_1015011 [Candidatus Kentron sp. LPFa]